MNYRLFYLTDRVLIARLGKTKKFLHSKLDVCLNKRLKKGIAIKIKKIRQLFKNSLLVFPSLLLSRVHQLFFVIIFFRLKSKVIQ